MSYQFKAYYIYVLGSWNASVIVSGDTGRSIRNYTSLLINGNGETYNVQTYAGG